MSHSWCRVELEWGPHSSPDPQHNVLLPMLHFLSTRLWWINPSPPEHPKLHSEEVTHPESNGQPSTMPREECDFILVGSHKRKSTWLENPSTASFSPHGGQCLGLEQEHGYWAQPARVGIWLWPFLWEWPSVPWFLLQMKTRVPNSEGLCKDEQGPWMLAIEIMSLSVFSWRIRVYSNLYWFFSQFQIFFSSVLKRAS